MPSQLPASGIIGLLPKSNAARVATFDCAESERSQRRTPGAWGGIVPERTNLIQSPRSSTRVLTAPSRVVSVLPRQPFCQEVLLTATSWTVFSVARSAGPPASPLQTAAPAGAVPVMAMPVAVTPLTPKAAVCSLPGTHSVLVRP